jgi:hypothetical protein
VRDTSAMIEALDRLTVRYGDQLEPDAFAEFRKSFMITRRTHQAGQHKAIADVGPFTIKKGEHYDNPTNVRLYGDGEWDSLIRWLCFCELRPT